MSYIYLQARGGGIYGGMLCGHSTICAVEINPYCREVLLQRQRDGIMPKFPIWDDVSTFDGNPWCGKTDIVAGGFPCQDISYAKGANRKGIEGAKSGLWKHMARIIREVQPRFAFVENSAALVFLGLDRVLGDLAEMGFDAKWGVFSAGDVGARHERERLWIRAANRNANCKFGLRKEREIYFRPGFEPIREMQKDEWPAEHQMDRMLDGLARWKQQHSAIGNGQVPAVAALAWNQLR